MPRFVATPEIPTSGLAEIEASIFTALKENVELLTGTRGEVDYASASLVRGHITVKSVGNQNMVSPQNISPEGYTISGSDVASLLAFRALKNDVQELANDLYRTREALDLLIKNFGGS
jgi:hypothetical protein|tara:strand:+ start:2977 stop:3330 length:354 start_codon:yes stop_codon:yes gene_type:complete